MFAEPSFKIFILSLPVLPNSGSRTNGASGGAEIINIERLSGVSNFTFGVFEVVKNEFGVFGKI